MGFMNTIDDLLITPAAAIMLPIVGILVLREMSLFTQAMFTNCFGPIAREVVDERNADWVQSSAKLLAAFISFIVIGVSVFFIFHLHDVTKCNAYVCPKARFLGPNDPDPYVNYTVDYYRCEEQKLLLKSMWSNSLVLWGPIISTILTFTPLLVAYVTSPKIIKFMKYSFVIVMLLYINFVLTFQEHFETDIMAYIRSVCIIFVLTMLLFFMSTCLESQTKLNRMIFAVMIIIGIVLLVHVGYNGFHLMCGKGTRLLPGYLVSHCSLVFSYAMFHEYIVPHAALAMSLFIIPPICPFVIALTAWSFDTFWKDLSTMDADQGVPSIPRIAGVILEHFADEEYAYQRRQGGWLYSRRRGTRRGHPSRGLS